MRHMEDNKRATQNRNRLNYKELVSQANHRFELGFDFVFTAWDSRSKVWVIINSQESLVELCTDLNTVTLLITK